MRREALVAMAVCAIAVMACRRDRNSAGGDPSDAAASAAVRTPNPDPAAERAIQIAEACARGPSFGGKGINGRPLDFSRGYAQPVTSDASPPGTLWVVNFGEVFPSNQFVAPSGLYLSIDTAKGSCTEQRPME